MCVRVTAARHAAPPPCRPAVRRPAHGASGPAAAAAAWAGKLVEEVVAAAAALVVVVVVVVGAAGCADHVGVARGSRTMFSELCRETLKRSVIEGIQAFQDLLHSKTREYTRGATPRRASTFSLSDHHKQCSSDNHLLLILALYCCPIHSLLHTFTHSFTPLPLRPLIHAALSILPSPSPPSRSLLQPLPLNPTFSPYVHQSLLFISSSGSQSAYVVRCISNHLSVHLVS